MEDVIALRKRMYLFSMLGFVWIILSFVFFALQEIVHLYFSIATFLSLVLVFVFWYEASRLKVRVKNLVKKRVDDMIVSNEPEKSSGEAQ